MSTRPILPSDVALVIDDEVRLIVQAAAQMQSARWLDSTTVVQEAYELLDKAIWERDHRSKQRIEDLRRRVTLAEL